MLVVRAASPDDERLRQQEAALSAESNGLAVRDVLVVEWVGNRNPEVWLSDGKAIPADALAEIQPGLRTAAWCVLLVGRDGRAKVAWDKVVPTDEIFAQIDAMPMGQSEKRARESNACR